MTIWITILVTLLFIAMMAYVILENKKQKELERIRKENAQRHKLIQSTFKRRLNEYIEKRMLRPKDRDLLYLIAVNFFIFRRLSTESLSQLDKTIGLVLNTIDKAIQSAQSVEDKEMARLHIQEFIQLLPLSGRDYNLDFYDSVLPSLIARLESYFMEPTIEIEVPEFQESPTNSDKEEVA